jgi:hypothetical protein
VTPLEKVVAIVTKAMGGVAIVGGVYFVFFGEKPLIESLKKLWRRRRGTPLPPLDNGLVVPSGPVPLGSSFYIRRSTDDELYDYIQRQRSGTITTVRGARQTGKTSLLARVAQYARDKKYLTIHIDFQRTFSRAELTSLDIVLRSLAYAIAKEIDVQATSVDQIWSEPTGVKSKIEDLLERQVLKKAKRPVFLIIDEADAVLDKSFHADFFGLFRSWNNRAAFSELWKKLNVVMAISTHPSVLIKDVQQSPFNVGLRLRLRDFTEAQILALNVQYASPLKASEIDDVIKLLGGHPYLIQKALYTMAHEKKTWLELKAVATQVNGPFDAHLRYYMELLQQDPDCIQAAQAILQSKICPPLEIRQKLESAGLIEVVGDQCRFRYGLYRLYFGDQLT